MTRAEIIDTTKKVRTKDLSRWDKIQALIEFILSEAAKGDLKKPSIWKPWSYFRWAKLGYEIVERIIKIFK